MRNIIILSLLIVLTSCSLTINNNSQPVKEQPPITNIANIENIQWTLVTFNGKPVPASVEGKVHIMLSKDDNRLSGSNGCNRLMGNYDITNGLQISFSKIASTLMACRNQGWDENAFNEMLEKTNNFVVDNNQLYLHVGKSAPLAVFAKTYKEGITNKYWKLIELEGQEVEFSPNQAQEQYFIIRDDGSITGFAGCNYFSGNYTLEEDKMRIRFNNLLSTLKACPDSEIKESELFKVFELADNFIISNDILRLIIGRRAPLAVFEAVYF